MQTEEHSDNPHQKCLNCDQVLPISAKFCFNCGQNTLQSKRSFWKAATNSMHELLDIDGRLSQTIKHLLFSPGKLTADHIAGKRVRYTPALRLYLVSSILFFLFITAFPEMWDAQGSQALETLEYVPKLMFVLFPLFALLVTVMFSGSYLLCNLVYAMHIHTAAYIFLLIEMPLEHLEADILGLKYTPVTHLFNVYMLWYFFKSFKLVFNRTWLKTILVSFLALVIYTAIMVFTLSVGLRILSNGNV